MAQLWPEPNLGSVVSYLHGSRNGLPDTSLFRVSPAPALRRTICLSVAGFETATHRSVSAAFPNS